MFLMFLILFSYVVLCDFYPIPTYANLTNLSLAISAPEIVLIIWVSLFAIDEVKEVSIQINQNLKLFLSYSLFSS